LARPRATRPPVAPIQLFEEVLQARVSRVTHIATGDRSCTYRIEPREA